jgi:hypothetical protein
MTSRRQRDYSKGKIYKLECLTTGKVYIGSTTKQYLSQRLTSHRYCFDAWKKGKMRYVTAYEIIECNDYQITLLEAYPCSSLDELLARERHWIESMHCINKCRPVREEQERIEYHREYYKTNRETQSDQSKERYARNQEQILAKNKEWREANKEKLKEKSNQYREIHKEQKRLYDIRRREALKQINRQS